MRTVDSTKENVMFCILQDAKQEKNDINEALYDAQNMLWHMSQQGIDVEKAFAYGSKYNYLKQFDKIKQDVEIKEKKPISYVRYSIENYSLVDCVLSAMNLLKEKYLEDKNKIESRNTIVFLTNLREIDVIQNQCIKGILSFFEDFEVKPIFICDDDKSCPAIAEYTKKKHGKIYTAAQFKHAVLHSENWNDL